MGNIRSNIQELNENDKAVVVTDTIHGPQSVTFITAKGLYKILFRSRKPIAEQFQNWVCDVVEELRLNGQYSLQSKVNELENKLQEAEQSIEELEKQNIYGIMLKKDIYINKSGSSTGKRVEKKDVKSNHLIAQWKTIAKAAESEKMCSAKMSRSIKNKTVFNNDYYYCCVK